MGITQGPDGMYYAVMQISDGNVSIAATFTDQNNYEEDIAHLIDALIQVKADLRQAKSGLITVKEVPDGFGGQQGRPANGKSRTSVQGPRPPKR
jgi:hypothetical protein